MSRPSSRNLATLLFRGAVCIWWLALFSAALTARVDGARILFVLGNMVAVLAGIYRWVLPDRPVEPATGSISRLNLENSGARLLKGPNAPR